MPAWKALLVIGVVSTAHADPLTLPVVVFDHAGVPPSILAQAEAYYSAVLGRAGIDIEWIHPNPGTHEIRVDVPALVVYLFSIEQANRFQTRTRGCLGRAVVSPAAAGPIYSAVIFYDNIRATVRRRDPDVPLVLGHVIAHETGHLLIGKAHTVTGIMRPDWSADLLSKIKQGLAVFTPKESIRMRSNLLARRRAAQTPSSD